MVLVRQFIWAQNTQVTNVDGGDDGVCLYVCVDCGRVRACVYVCV